MEGKDHPNKEQYFLAVTTPLFIKKKISNKWVIRLISCIMNSKNRMYTVSSGYHATIDAGNKRKKLHFENWIISNSFWILFLHNACWYRELKGSTKTKCIFHPKQNEGKIDFEKYPEKFTKKQSSSDT